ncbi:hypothetical protein DCAR_0101204 [Daucus carota subsp. sativus]|uniref:DUF1985 domain-containing protein n=1 Tax=Daucus carota subsp. sativus TaxID=79200 RepID=A0AAF0W5K4_DAUCS|nr:hypothetical protein DCAR_0101204 [Daucus carota subsp. sativus]
MKIGISFNTLSKSNVSGRTEKQKKTVFNGSGDGEASASKKIPPATFMLWVRNLRRFIGFGTGLGSEALMEVRSICDIHRIAMKIEGAKHLNVRKDEVKLRVSPRILSEMIFHLTDEQRKWVHRSGFGLLLNFELEMLPAKLAYNVLQIFDHNSVSLKLKSLDIQITEDDVFDVLGLPYGGLKIQLADETKFKQREECWNAQFSTEKEREQITAQMLVQKMRKQRVSDTFKLNFLIVMSNALIGTTSSSYVDKQLLRIDDDLDHLQRYNWSEYLLHYLVIATEAWNRTASTFFRGSLVFLTLLYVDRVRHMGIKLVERTLPSYIGWTHDELKERQRMEVIDGIFGVGSLVPPIREILKETDCCKADQTKNEYEDDWDDPEVWKQMDEVVKIHKEKKNSKTTQQRDDMAEDNTDEEPPTEDVIEKLLTRAQDLVASKLKFDDDLKKALEMYPDNDSLHFIVEVMDEHFHQRKTSDVEDDEQLWAEDPFFNDQQDDTIIQDDQHDQIIPEKDDQIIQDENLESNQDTDIAKSSTKLPVAKNNQDIQDHQLRRLRIKYNTAILSSGLNAFQKGIVDEAAKLAEKAATYKDFKVAAFEKNPTFPKSILKNTSTSAKKKVIFATNLNTIFEAAAEEQGTQEEQDNDN